jgi:hypothetical protein
MSQLREGSILTEAHLKQAWTDLRSPSELAILNGLTILEMCLVIACKHLQVKTAALIFFKRWPGANPTIASYNASVVKIYSAVNSMAHF